MPRMDELVLSRETIETGAFYRVIMEATTYLSLQTFRLLLASYFLGGFVACMVKRSFFGAGADEPARILVPAQAGAPVRPPVVMPPQPVRVRHVQQVAPRAIDPVQPKIEV